LFGCWHTCARSRQDHAIGQEELSRFGSIYNVDVRRNCMGAMLFLKKIVQYDQQSVKSRTVKVFFTIFIKL